MQQFRSKDSALAALAARTTLIAAGKCALYQDDGFVPDPSSTLADLAAHEANYTGYTAGGIAVGAGMGPYESALNEWSEAFPSILFQPTGGPITPNQIRGCYFDDGAGNLEEVWIFDQPVTMASTLDALLIQPVIRQTSDPRTAEDPSL